MARRAENDDIRVLPGNALDQRTLETAGIKEASTLLIAIPEGFEAGAIFQRAQELNPDLRVIARAHSDAEVQHLERLGVPDVITGEREVAARMLILSAERSEEHTSELKSLMRTSYASFCLKKNKKHENHAP